MTDPGRPIEKSPGETVGRGGVGKAGIDAETQEAGTPWTRASDEEWNDPFADLDEIWADEPVHRRGGRSREAS
jgi:hypothetical protein